MDKLALFQFDRPGTFAEAFAAYQVARDIALSDATPTSDTLDAWGNALDSMIATRALDPVSVGNKVRTILLEGRGGEGCLTAILDDLDAITSRPGSAASFNIVAALAEREGATPEMLDELARQLSGAAAAVRASAGKAVGNA